MPAVKITKRKEENNKILKMVEYLKPLSEEKGKPRKIYEYQEGKPRKM
jgi:hypothetical protein